MIILRLLAIPNSSNLRFVHVPDINGRMYMEDLHAFKSRNFYDAVSNVKFFLYTRQNVNSSDTLNMTLTSIKKSHFRSSRNTYFLIHGWITELILFDILHYKFFIRWINDVGSPFNVICKEALMKNSDVNVIVVDWSAYANTLNYVSAR